MRRPLRSDLRPDFTLGQIMFKRSRMGWAVLAVAGGIAGVGTAMPAWAQGSGSTAAAGSSTATQSVTVTGSRILRPELGGSSPTVAVSLETMGNLGIENFADMATQLPQFAPSFGASRTQSTFSGVAASGLNLANLRNLGSARTLVLINGRRVAGGTSTSTAVDFNNLPTANIERIEIITGGASAVYGSDAVAGVINIITKRRFEGLELSAGYSQASEGDNENPTGHVMWGMRFGDQGRLLATLQLDKQGLVSCKDRYICAEDFFWGTPATQLRGPTAYSGVGLAPRIFIGGNSFTSRNGSFTNAQGQLIPFDVTIDGYNRNADRDIAIPTERVMAALEAEWALGARTRVFAEFNYGKTSIDSQFEGHPFQSQAPGSLFGALQPTIPLDNPFVPAAVRSAIDAFNATATPATQINQITWWQRFNDAGGARGASNEREMTRAVLGLRGELDTLAGFGRDFRWELSHVAARTKVALGTEGLVSTSNLYHGLRVEPVPGSPGQFRCVDAAARAAGCVPINPFAPYTPEMQKALGVSSTSQGTADLSNTVASLTGTVAELPAGSLRVAAGLEWRSFEGGLDHSDVINQGGATGNQIADTARARLRTQEVFAEALVPVLADLPGVRALNLEAALRHSDAGRFNYDTWKFGGDWEVVDGLRFRGMRARSVRSPLPGELSGGGQTAGVVNDPCTAARRNLNPTRAANCTADGVPADYAPAVVIEQSVSGQTGGNPNLTPEVGTTLTLGLVWEPRALRGFSLAIDRFKIDLSDVITTVSRQIAADRCYDTPDRQLCGAVTRGANPLLPGANYVLTAVNEQLQNIAALSVQGVDIDVKYRWTTSIGQFDASALFTLYDKALLVPLPGSAPTQLLGQAGGSTNDQGWVKLTGATNLGWRQGPWSANWNVRYIGSADMAPNTTANGFPRVPEALYHNVRVGYAFGKGHEAWFGITNVGDKKPPFFASGASGTQALDTIPGYYDVFGRSYFGGVKLTF